MTGFTTLCRSIVPFRKLIFTYNIGYDKDNLTSFVSVVKIYMNTIAPISEAKQKYWVSKVRIPGTAAV
ncbi:hypothetical protein EWB00_003118 [Schistosoma japonicum]|uniref:Uncharacterized protein n=1 Tax=Schistosoma japonicum TaxID=6182 RepID=A0A4Z2D9K5_SCHJA|nr:hypothetical protein EWB00_003118 [Schistosoma japonicum]